MPKSKIMKLVIFLGLILANSGASAQEEPWGGNVPGWRFTQAAEGGGVNCRAWQGPYLIARRSSGRHYVSLPRPADVPQGSYKEGRASLVFGNVAEPVDAESGSRLIFAIDDGLYPALLRTRGYQWRVASSSRIASGSVSFSGDLSKVIAELRACVNANAAAAPARRPAAPANKVSGRWEGEWNWIRPLVLFGQAGPKRGPRLSVELLADGRARICPNLNELPSCRVVTFTEQTSPERVYRFSSGADDLYEIRLAARGGLAGQFWFKRDTRTRMSADGTFLLN